MIISRLLEGVNYEHSRKVSAISGILAETMGYPPREREIIEQAALYHDIGKDAIPKDILNKPCALLRDTPTPARGSLRTPQGF